MKALIAGLSLLLLGGCATNGQTPWAALTAGGSCPKPGSDQELALNLADEMAGDGKLHASLANLQSLPANLPQVRLRQAKAYRLLGRSEAQPLYQSLIGTCMAAEGEHGLGQLASAKGDNGQAMAHLQRAARLAPTDEKIRNDLGVVYLNQLRLEDARFEFMTAMELKQSDPLAAINLVTLMIYQDNWKQAAQVASQMNLSPEQVTDAQARAEKLKGASVPVAKVKDQVATMSDAASTPRN
ncbi:tetratricopeptide repeat protein [Pseudomonas edaphica]|jgi:Flp pilus assembly protein TadD|uniref:Tetratricopeptide repeat protein n=1 Tax=Pseudomonas edaphica TaxID=2006980 RepID=A0A5R8R3F1_9PSED|nr:MULTISPECIES: tetratricopeptide repeat protein [Pseudomonas]MCF5229288.1 tetratricopeptide repeat protein [Pseudomonas sp. PA-5-4H]MCF5235869.1 tetratricopeptide repeat protein [Pseudomonas sp. PA-5-4G]MCF5247003.1 tetratricopeptide repeat protein [Pseudomonas sp. PA-5-4B]MCF5253698.1 tetratricopeptide repeat protein [Pseudomonas sp. PA-5-4B]MCF5258902.1 tetratricopeptide repeat protein [Pseudomonas sp. PA-5-4A]